MRYTSFNGRRTLIFPSIRVVRFSYSHIDTVLRFCRRLKMKWMGARRVLRAAPPPRPVIVGVIEQYKLDRVGSDRQSVQMYLFQRIRLRVSWV